MTQEQQAKLFRPFVQIESDFGKDRGGWGLGLSICANIAKRLGGEIGVHSVPGEGSIFSFEMDAPVAAAAAPGTLRRAEPPAAPGQAGPKLRILLAEDNPPNRDLMQLLLSDLGHEVVAVDNGFEAVAATMRDRYDLVVLDIMMPGLDGLGAGMNAFLPKPIDREELRQVIGEVMRGAIPAAPRPGP